MTEDKMVGWHYQLNGHGFGWTLGVSDGQGGLACCSSWGFKESDTTEWLIRTELDILHVQPLSCVWLFMTPWAKAHQDPLSFSTSLSLLKLLAIELVKASNHLIPCHPLLVLPSAFPSIRVFSIESSLHIRWPKYWSFSISLSNEYSGLIFLGLTCLISLLSKGFSRVFSNSPIQKHQFFGSQPFLWSNTHIHTRLLGKW